MTASRRSPNVAIGAAAAARRRATAATGAAPSARRSSIAATVPRRASPAATPRRAANANGGCRCSTIRPTCTRCSRRYFRAGRRPIRRRLEGRRRADGRRAVRDPRVAAALRRRARRQQAFEQRDGAPGVPDARDGEEPAAGDDAGATATVRRWLASHKLKMPELVLDNGSGLSRVERISAGSLVRLLLAADASTVREEFASSLAVAAMDGTVERRFQNVNVAGQALLKTGHARRRARDRRLRHRRRRTALGARGDRQPPQRRRACRARSISSCSGSTATRRRGKRITARCRRLPSKRRMSGSLAADRHIPGIGWLSLNQQEAANEAVDSPDRRAHQDRDRERDADQRDEQQHGDHVPQQRPPERADEPREMRRRPTSPAPRRASRRRRSRRRCPRDRKTGANAMSPLDSSVPTTATRTAHRRASRR